MSDTPPGFIIKKEFFIFPCQILLCKSLLGLVLKNILIAYTQDSLRFQKSENYPSPIDVPETHLHTYMCAHACKFTYMHTEAGSYQGNQQADEICQRLADQQKVFCHLCVLF